MLWKEGKKKALTLSYDDGVIHDRRFVELLNKYGIKCTFNLNSETFNKNTVVVGENDEFREDYVHVTITAEEVKKLYEGHEIASHSCTHPNLVGMSEDKVKRELLSDVANLEALSGQKVVGFAYPYGTYDEELMGRLSDCGLVYARTVNSHEQFIYPTDFLAWHPTLHHKSPKLFEVAKRFLESEEEGDLFYLWGHSYEFYEDNNWDMIEDFMRLMSEHKDEIWFATNREIYEYINEHK